MTMLVDERSTTGVDKEDHVPGVSSTEASDSGRSTDSTGIGSETRKDAAFHLGREMVDKRSKEENERILPKEEMERPQVNDGLEDDVRSRDLKQAQEIHRDLEYGESNMARRGEERGPAGNATTKDYQQTKSHLVPVAPGEDRPWSEDNRDGVFNGKKNLPPSQTFTGTSHGMSSYHGVTEPSSIGHGTGPTYDAVRSDMVSSRSSRSSRSSKRRNAALRRRQKICLLLILLLVSAVLAIALFFGITNINKEKEGSPHTPLSIRLPGASPFLDLLLTRLPTHTQESLVQSIETPQWEAWEWLENHPELPDMPEWRKEQLFALATFFYAMGGPYWFSKGPPVLPLEGPFSDQGNAVGWLHYDINECDWYFGEIRSKDDDSEFAQDPLVQSYGDDPCDSDGHYRVIFLSDLKLYGHKPSVPPEIALLTSLNVLAVRRSGITVFLPDFLPSPIHDMTNLSIVDFSDNGLTGTIPGYWGMDLNRITGLHLEDNSLTGAIPSELGTLSAIIELQLGSNSFDGHIPSELAMAANLAQLNLNGNSLTKIPTELGMMTALKRLNLMENSIAGPIPSELGLLTSLTGLGLENNRLTGPVPTVLGKLPNIEVIMLSGNSLTGTIPSELGLPRELYLVGLGNNRLSGSIPTQIGQLSNLQAFSVENNGLTGIIPSELSGVVDTFDVLSLTNNGFSGNISDDLCVLEMFNPELGMGLAFDCSEQLCGCCWCSCTGKKNSTNATECRMAGTGPVYVDPHKVDMDWPGLFPTPINSTNAITINIHSDNFPEETTWEWSRLVAQDTWEILDSNSLPRPRSLFSETKEVESLTYYLLKISDSFGDGTCCGVGGFGWFTITNSTPSIDSAEGTVVWQAPGDALDSELNVLLWIDGAGRAQHIHSIIE